MNGIESTGSAGFTDHAFHRTAAPARPAAATPGNGALKPSAGMAGALQLSGEFLRQTMSEIGFIDIQANNLEKLKAFIDLRLQPQEQAMEVSFDPITASEVAARMGAQVAGDINLALRVVAQVDPARVAALLK